MSIPRLRRECLRWSAVALLLGACANSSSPTEERVRANYAAAAGDPTIRGYASVELYEARQELEHLQRAVRHDEERAEVEHRAYVAQQRIEIARLAAESAVLEDQARLLAADRDRLRLRARDQDVSAAENRAAAAEEAAEEAHEQARAGQLAAAEARADSAEQRAAAAEQQLGALEGRQTERGVVLTLDAGLFAVDRTELQPGARAELDRIGSFLEAHPGREVSVEGHTDDVGDAQYNVALSERRARVVAEHLIARGVDPQRIHVEGFGASRPIAPNDSASGRQQNRRVEVVIAR